MSLGRNWRSCLHPEDGEYNTACVEYNTGKDSLLSFVIPKSEVNNIYVEKIWRQIMYITDNVGINTSDAINGEVAVFSQKGYPSTNEYADEISQKYIKEHLPELQLRPLRAGHISLRPAWGSQEGYGYIDCFKGFTNSSINQVILSNAAKDRTDFTSRVSATEGVPCFECGCEGVELSSTNGLCDTCAGDGYYCEWCGCYCDEDDEVSVHSSQGEISMCRECADNEAVWSDYYQDLILIEDSVDIISPYYTKDEIIKKMQHEGLLSHDIIKIDDFINLMTRNSAREVVLMEDSVYSEMIDIDLLSSDATEVKICFEGGDSQLVYLPSEFAKVASELIFKE